MGGWKLEKDRSWTRCKVHTRLGRIRPMDAEKNKFKDLKRRRMSRTGKNEMNLTCPCANRLRCARLKTLDKIRYRSQHSYMKEKRYHTFSLEWLALTLKKVRCYLGRHWYVESIWHKKWCKGVKMLNVIKDYTFTLNWPSWTAMF